MSKYLWFHDLSSQRYVVMVCTYLFMLQVNTYLRNILGLLQVQSTMFISTKINFDWWLSHGLTNWEVPHVERSLCGKSLPEKGGGLQKTATGGRAELCLGEYTSLPSAKPCCGQYIILDYHQGITTYGAPSQKVHRLTWNGRTSQILCFTLNSWTFVLGESLPVEM